jgi:hypothetical protein
MRKCPWLQDSKPMNLKIQIPWTGRGDRSCSFCFIPGVSLSLISATLYNWSTKFMLLYLLISTMSYYLHYIIFYFTSNSSIFVSEFLDKFSFIS